MFLELMTAWKTEDSKYNDEGKSQGSGKSTSKGPEENNMLDPWDLRRVGVLFSKQQVPV